MIKTITVKWLKEIDACEEAIEAFSKRDETDSLKILEILIKENPGWADWLIIRLMNYRQYVAYTNFKIRLQRTILNTGMELLRSNTTGQ